MPKKVTIASGIALIMLIAVIVILINVCKKEPFAPPDKVSVYLTEDSEIVTVSYEEFLAGCICGLLPENSDYDPQALRAVAAAVNSRAMNALITKKSFQNLGADFSASTELPFSLEAQPNNKINEAVSEGIKMLLTYDGEPINAQMCIISTGATDDCPPVSPSVALPCDINAYGYESRFAYTAMEVWRALHGKNAATANCAEWFHDAVYADNGTLLYISFCDTRITGAALKKALGLRSTAIAAEYTDEKFYFTCYGLGENKGMSVNAADFLAKNGKTAEEILEVFYPGAGLVELH